MLSTFFSLNTPVPGGLGRNAAQGSLLPLAEVFYGPLPLFSLQPFDDTALRPATSQSGPAFPGFGRVEILFDFSMSALGGQFPKTREKSFETADRQATEPFLNRW